MWSRPLLHSQPGVQLHFRPLRVNPLEYLIIRSVLVARHLTEESVYYPMGLSKPLLAP